MMKACDMPVGNDDSCGATVYINKIGPLGIDKMLTLKSRNSSKGWKYSHKREETKSVTSEMTKI